MDDLMGVFGNGGGFGANGSVPQQQQPQQGKSGNDLLDGFAGLDMGGSSEPPPPQQQFQQQQQSQQQTPFGGDDDLLG